MKKRLLIAAGLLGSGVWAQAPAALVTEVSGAVSAPQGALLRGKPAPPGVYKLPAGSARAGRFTSDGHRERVEGPGEFRLQPAHLVALHGEPVERSRFSGRVLAAPDLLVYTQGGSVSTAAHRHGRVAPLQRPTSPISSGSPPAVPPPSSTTRGGSDDEDIGDSTSAKSSAGQPVTTPRTDAEPVPIVTPEERAAAGLDYSAATGWSLLLASTPSPQPAQLFVRNLQTGDLRDLSDQLGDGQTVVPLPLRDRDLHRLKLTEGKRTTTVTFRCLNAEESRLLDELTTGSAPDPASNLARAEQFARLGLFHAAAAEARAYLNDSFQPDVEVAARLLGWYRHELGDERAARDLIGWSRERGWKLRELR